MHFREIFGKKNRIRSVQTQTGLFRNGLIRDNQCMQKIQVNECSFRGDKSFIFLLSSLLNVGQLLKEWICSSRSKFFPLRVSPFGKGVIAQGSKDDVTKVVSLSKNNCKSLLFTTCLRVDYLSSWNVRILGKDGRSNQVVDFLKPSVTKCSNF